MSLDIYQMEATQEASTAQGKRALLVPVVSSMMTMTFSFVFFAVFMSVVVSGVYMGWLPLLSIVFKSALLVGAMFLASTVIAQAFSVPLVRRVNAMVLGMVAAFAMVLFNVM